MKLAIVIQIKLAMFLQKIDNDPICKDAMHVDNRVCFSTYSTGHARDQVIQLCVVGLLDLCRRPTGRYLSLSLSLKRYDIRIHPKKNTGKSDMIVEVHFKDTVIP